MVNISIILFESVVVLYVLVLYGYLVQSYLHFCHILVHLYHILFLYVLLSVEGERLGVVHIVQCEDRIWSRLEVFLVCKC